jgi:hypothetical protein
MALAFMLATRLPTSSELISPYRTHTVFNKPILNMSINNTTVSSVAYTGCLSWIRIFSHPGSKKPGSRISDPTTKKRRNFLLLFYMFCSHKFTKFKIILFFNRYRKIFVLPSSQKYGLGIRDLGKHFPDPDLGVKKAPDPGSQIRTPQH